MWSAGVDSLADSSAGDALKKHYSIMWIEAGCNAIRFYGIILAFKEILAT
jgi:hypothetical protein